MSVARRPLAARGSPWQSHLEQPMRPTRPLRPTTRRVGGLGAGLLLATLAGCSDKGNDNAQPDLAQLPENTLPPFVKGAVVAQAYDGNSDDLLTGGVGQSGLPTA